MLTTALILVSLYLPGHSLGGRLVRKGDGLTELVLARVAVSLAVACPLLTGLALAGWFTLPAVVGGLLALAVVCTAVAHRLKRGEGSEGERARFGWWDLGVAGLVAGAFALYARPAEYVVNWRDPGVYTLFAEKLARTGALLHHDLLVRAVAPFHPFAGDRKYPGFYLLGGDLVVPQFFPGPFAFFGLGNLAGGLWGTLFVVPVLGALCAGTAYALGSELFGRWAGILGAALLAVGYPQVWWARHPTSEVMTQLFVLAGLWLAARFVRDGDRAAGVLAGLLLGGVMLIRVDAFLAAAAVPLLFFYELLFGRGGPREAVRWLYPGVPLAIFAALAFLYLNTVGGRYLYVIYTEHGLGDALALAPYGVPAALVLVGALVYARRRWGGRVSAYLEARGRRFALAGALGIAAAVLWGYFVLPVPWETLPGNLTGYDAYRGQILLRLAWFTTPLAGALGLAGFVLAAHRLDAGRALFLGALLALGGLYVVIPNVSPDVPWATRRFVPIFFPAVALLAGHATLEAGRWLGRAWRPRAGTALSCALAILALGWTAYTAYPIVGFRELDGAAAAFDRLNEEIPEAKVVYVEAPDGYDYTASTFEYLYDRPTLPYDPTRFGREVDELAAAGLMDDAVYVTTDGGPAPLLADFDFREVAAETVRLPRVRPVTKELPTEKEGLELRYRVFRVEKEAG